MTILTKNLVAFGWRKLLSTSAAISLIIIGAGLVACGLGCFDGTTVEPVVRGGLTAISLYLLVLFILFGR